MNLKSLTYTVVSKPPYGDNHNLDGKIIYKENVNDVEVYIWFFHEKGHRRDERHGFS